jgi:hypothetical protein
MFVGVSVHRFAGDLGTHERPDASREPKNRSTEEQLSPHGTSHR